MFSISRIVLYISAFILILGLHSCVDDEVVRLSTDVTVEGAEMFNTSFAISEHLNHLVQPFERYAEIHNDTLPLHGCPIINVDQAERRVRLTFNPRISCPDSLLRRSGTISMYFTNSLITNEEIVLVEYLNYRVRNSRIEGSRLLTKRTGTELDIFKDTMAQLMIYDEHGSSTRVTAEYEHQLMIGADLTEQINTTGSGGGRNLAGRSFTFTLNNRKVQRTRCIEDGIYVPSAGSETWTFERTISPAVTHRMNYPETNDCDRNVSIILSNGELLNLRQ